MDWSKEATRMKLENEINLAKQKWRPEAQASISIRVIKKQDRSLEYSTKDGKMTGKYK